MVSDLEFSDLYLKLEDVLGSSNGANSDPI
jgi:hypothetical protein